MKLRRLWSESCRTKYALRARLMHSCSRISTEALLLMLLCLAPKTGVAQTLVPRAYVITPLNGNAITLTYNYNVGDVLFDPAIPITDASAKFSVASFNYYHAFSFFGRSANVTASLPYGVGTFSGSLVGIRTSLYRSGLVDSAFRLAVNLKGGPAMDVTHFRKWRQKTLIGVSLLMRVPTGQYDPARLVNPGSHRWALKPELGLSRRWGSWVLDAYGGGWFFSENSRYFPGASRQTAEAIGSVETHLSYDLKPRFWFSLDGNFWYGGATSVNGLFNPRSRQKSSRVGASMSMPLSRHQSLKFNYSISDYARIGGKFQTISTAWQYSWIGKP